MRLGVTASDPPADADGSHRELAAVCVSARPHGQIPSAATRTASLRHGFDVLQHANRGLVVSGSSLTGPVIFAFLDEETPRRGVRPVTANRLRFEHCGL